MQFSACINTQSVIMFMWFLFFSSRRRHTRYWRDWSSACALPISEGLGPPGDGVLVDVVVDGLLGGVLELLRTGEVGEPLREVDPSGRRAQPRHLTDHRLLERARLGTGPPALRCHATPSRSLEPRTTGAPLADSTAAPSAEAAPVTTNAMP